MGNHVLILGKRVVREGAPLIEVPAINDALARFHPGERCDDRLFTFSAAVAADSPFSLSRYTELGVFWRDKDGFVPLRYREDPAYHFDPYLTKPHLYLAEADISFLITGYYLDKGLEDQLRSYAESNGFVDRPLGRLRKYDLTLHARPECLPEGSVDDPGAFRRESQ